MQREAGEAEVVNDGRVLSEAEQAASDADAATQVEHTDASSKQQHQQKKKKRRPVVAAPHKKRSARSAPADKGAWESERAPKRHRGQATLTTQQVLRKSLSDGTIQDMCLRAGIATKTAPAAEMTRRVFLSVTKTLLEATLEHTASRRCKTATLDDVRQGHKSQVGRNLYTHTATCKADYANRRPPREKTLRLRRQRARELKHTMAKPLAAAAAEVESEKN